jgi:hypothetical protein
VVSRFIGFLVIELLIALFQRLVELNSPAFFLLRAYVRRENAISGEAKNVFKPLATTKLQQI